MRDGEKCVGDRCFLPGARKSVDERTVAEGVHAVKMLTVEWALVPRAGLEPARRSRGSGF
jgi:hypothetical protein